MALVRLEYHIENVNMTVTEIEIDTEIVNTNTLKKCYH